jgi:hypothetical protein
VAKNFVPQSGQVRHYLGSVLLGLVNFPINRIGQLTPGAWAGTELL